MDTAKPAVRSATQVLVVVCPLATIGASVWLALPVYQGANLAQAIGGAVSTFMTIAGGPLIWWAYHQFRYAASVGPLTLWVGINLLILLVIYAGAP